MSYLICTCFFMFVHRQSEFAAEVLLGQTHWVRHWMFSGNLIHAVSYCILSLCIMRPLNSNNLEAHCYERWHLWKLSSLSYLSLDEFRWKIWGKLFAPFEEIFRIELSSRWVEAVQLGSELSSNSVVRSLRMENCWWRHQSVTLEMSRNPPFGHFW